MWFKIKEMDDGSQKATCLELYCRNDRGPYQLPRLIGSSWAVMFSHPKDFTPVHH
jgi:alkyl hydroperoxide reductase subunit AhpC